MKQKHTVFCTVLAHAQQDDSVLQVNLNSVPRTSGMRKCTSVPTPTVPESERSNATVLDPTPRFDSSATSIRGERRG